MATGTQSPTGRAGSLQGCTPGHTVA